MNIDIITFCDSAHDYDGKLCIIGTFNTLTSDKFPVAPREFSFAVSVSFAPSECGVHTGELRLFKKDNPDLILVKFEMPLPIKPVAPDRRSYANLSGSLVGVVIPEPGIYVASFAVGNAKREIELYANATNA